MKEQWTTYVDIGVMKLKVNVSVTCFDGRYTARAYVPFSGLGESSNEAPTVDDAVFGAVHYLAQSVADRIVSTVVPAAVK
jgi:hypothetical protein